jgi:hypothetical protein
VLVAIEQALPATLQHLQQQRDTSMEGAATTAVQMGHAQQRCALRCVCLSAGHHKHRKHTSHQPSYSLPNSSVDFLPLAPGHHPPRGPINSTGTGFILKFILPCQSELPTSGASSSSTQGPNQQHRNRLHTKVHTPLPE